METPICGCGYLEIGVLRLFIQLEIVVSPANIDMGADVVGLDAEMEKFIIKN